MNLSHLAFRFVHYLRYTFLAVGAHSLHSPFLFALYTQLMAEAKRTKIPKIEKLRRSLRTNHEMIEVIDFKTSQSVKKSISQIAKTSSSQRKFSNFLRLLIDDLQAETVLETGTSLGLNTLYMAESNANHVITIEGSQIIAHHATENFRRLNQNEIKVVNDDLYATLEQVIVRHKPDFYFLDADHRSSAIAFCIDLILKHTPNTKCIVIHDIYWSADMKSMWDNLKDDPRFKLSVDLFQAGLLFPKLEMPKQHFVIRF